MPPDWFTASGREVRSYTAPKQIGNLFGVAGAERPSTDLDPNKLLPCVINGATTLPAI